MDADRLRVIAAIALMAMGAIAAEWALRWAHPGLAMRRYDQRFTGSHEIAVNSRGFRGELPHPDHLGVVLCLGDSTTYGTGVAAHATWPILLSDRERHGFPIVGVNGGMPATDLSQAIRSLQDVWHDYRPQAIAVALSGNMVSLALIRRDSQSGIVPHPASSGGNHPVPILRRLRYLASDSALVGGILWVAETLGYASGVNHHRIDPEAPFGAMLAQGWRQAGSDPQLSYRAWDELAAQLRVLKRWCQERGIPLVVTWIPSRFLISTERRDNLKFVPLRRLSLNANERCRTLCEELGIPFADALVALRRKRTAIESSGSPAPLYVLGDYTHLDADGHSAVADAIRAAILDLTSAQDPAATTP